MLNIDLTQLEKAAQDLSRITGLQIVIYDDKHKVILAYPMEMRPFCAEVRTSHQLEAKCLACDQKGFDLCDRTKRTAIYQCHMGLTEAISPICENGIIMGYLMFGQILHTDQRDGLLSHAVDAAAQYGVNADLLTSALRQMPVIDQEIIHAAADMMEMCACYLWLRQILNVKTDSLAQHAEDYITNHLAEDLSVKALCAYLNISKSALYSLSKDSFHMGISDYIRRKRLNTAKQLLVKESVPVSEVAVRCGIPDVNYFIKLFKKDTGATPLAFRKARQSAVR